MASKSLLLLFKPSFPPLNIDLPPLSPPMIEHILHIISIWIIILPLVAGIVNYQGLNKDSKWIFALVVIAAFPQILTYFVFHKETPLLNISYNIYTPIEFIVLYIIFYSKYEGNHNKRILQWSAGIYLLASIWFIVTKGLSAQFLNLWEDLNDLIYLVWILLFLQEQYHSDSFE